VQPFRLKALSHDQLVPSVPAFLMEKSPSPTKFCKTMTKLGLHQHLITVERLNMKMKFDIRSLVCGALLGAAAILLTGAALDSQNTAWEYTVHTYGGGFQPKIENLNKLGAEGWELAAPLTATDGAARGFVFKRRKVRD
jgi:hypothetical protein